MKRISYFFLLLLLIMLFLPLSTLANTITIRDILDREVQIPQPVRTLFLADSRDLLALDIVSGDKFFNQIVGWSDSLPQFAPDMLAAYAQKYPKLKKIPVLGKSGVTLDEETIITLKPDVVIANAKSYSVFTQTNALKKLTSAGIPVVFIDFMKNIEVNTPRSITILGELLDSQTRAATFNDIWYAKMAMIEAVVDTVSDKPTVLLERYPGLLGADFCCYIYGHDSFGFFASKAGAKNIADSDNNKDKHLPQNGGEFNAEWIMNKNPDYYIMTGADWTNYSKKSVAVALGYQVNRNKVNHQLQRLLERKGFQQLNAVRNHHVMAMYFHFYDNPLNIIAIEALAKFFHPHSFASLNVSADLASLHQQFISIPDNGIFWLVYGDTSTTP